MSDPYSTDEFYDYEDYDWSIVWCPRCKVLGTSNYHDTLRDDVVGSSSCGELIDYAKCESCGHEWPVDLEAIYYGDYSEHPNDPNYPPDNLVESSSDSLPF